MDAGRKHAATRKSFGCKAGWWSRGWNDVNFSLTILKGGRTSVAPVVGVEKSRAFLTLTNPVLGRGVSAELSCGLADAGP